MTKGNISGLIDRLALMAAVPGINLVLQGVALVQQSLVLWSERVDDLSQPQPEGLRVDTGSDNGFIDDKIIQGLGNMQRADSHIIHGHTSSNRRNGRPDAPWYVRVLNDWPKQQDRSSTSWADTQETHGWTRSSRWIRRAGVSSAGHCHAWQSRDARQCLHTNAGNAACRDARCRW